MGFRGRGGPRGGFSRGKGDAIGGKGRGRPTHTRDPRFETARTAEKEVEDEARRQDRGVEDVSENSQNEADSDSDDESAPVSRPYQDLMRSLTAGTPKPKRKKLHHVRIERELRQMACPELKKSSPEEDEEEGKKDMDQVDEPEQDDVDNASPEELLENEDDDVDSAEAFERHFASPNEKAVLSRIKAVKQGAWQTKGLVSKFLRILVSNPETADGGEPIVPAPIQSLGDLKLKKRLRDAVLAKRSKLDHVEQALSPFVFNYHDTLFCGRTVANSCSVRRLAAIHVLNHCFKTRDRVIKNNEKLARLARAGEDDDQNIRDQGFTRPRVLFLLPTRQTCAKMMDAVLSVYQPDQQENRKRFEESYMDKTARFSKDKPADFVDLFGGNDDDNFRLGVKLTRRTIKYFSPFYSSDIILASPLGLRMAIGSHEEKKADFDFLSSIEVVVVDQADALLVQNWEHVQHIFENLNLQPKQAHGCDFTRVREWYLEDHAKYYRQTLVFSAFQTPELSELFRAQCRNWAGKAKMQPQYAGAIQQLHGLQARQTFSRFDSLSIQADPDARFAYLTKAVLPPLLKRADDAAGTLLFVASYLDFVRVRNYLANDPAVAQLTFGTISEYAAVPEASRARSHFLSGRHRVLLYTERAHHFRRYQPIRGVKRVLIYSLPDNPLFYNEIVGGYLSRAEQDGLIERGRGAVRVMFSKYDVLKLERIVGSQRVARMVQERGDSFEFV